jgi:PBP1b-binding outer membrane lipoprotein LpoB
MDNPEVEVVLMKKIFAIVIALTFVLLLAGCLQQQSPPGSEIPKAGQNTTTAQDCMKTPGMSWCDKEQKCINPAIENCA